MILQTTSTPPALPQIIPAGPHIGARSTSLRVVTNQDGSTQLVSMSHLEALPADYGLTCSSLMVKRWCRCSSSAAKRSSWER